MQSLENQIWRSWLATSTKLKLYNVHLTIFLYGSDCLAISKTDTRKIDALDQWHLHMLIGIKWYQTHCYNPVTPAYPVWAYYAHGRQHRCQEILLASPPADWRRQPRRPHITWLSTVQQDLKQHHLTLPEAADLAQNRPLWRMMSIYLRVACQKRRR